MSKVVDLSTHRRAYVDPGNLAVTAGRSLTGGPDMLALVGDGDALIVEGTLAQLDGLVARMATAVDSLRAAATRTPIPCRNTVES
jgi:hypothetical protein